MDSAQNTDRTPRRSARLQKIREPTPEQLKSVAMMNVSAVMKSLPNILVTPASPVSHQKRRSRKKKVSEKEVEEEATTNTEISAHQVVINDPVKSPQIIVKKSSLRDRSSSEKALGEGNSVHNESVKDHQATAETGENSCVETDAPITVAVEATLCEEPETKINSTVTGDEEMMKESAAIAGASKEIEDTANTTPQLLDESIISVPETPPPAQETNSTLAPMKDATFSPEVDTSLIHDSRPHIDAIDIILNTTPVHRNKLIRTSTPLAQKLLKRETPKISAPVLSLLSKVLSPNVNAGSRKEIPSDNVTNGQIKMANLLERSILKGSRRKRSLSVADGESFMQKKVFFASPEIMDIDSIDVKMLQSFREEKETSILKQNMASGGQASAKRHKRSLSVSDTPSSSKTKTKMPNFRAIHQQQFSKMESIVDHAQRKAVRANRLATPSKLPAVPEKSRSDKTSHSLSKIPKGIVSRKPLRKISTQDAGIATIMPKPTKSDSNLMTKVAINLSSKAAVATSSSTAPQAMRKKIEERRERNTALYKGHAVKAGHDHRKKANTIIKGVRLNRRFELQMQHRFGGENSEN